MSKIKMVYPPHSTKDIFCPRVLGRFPPTYIYQRSRPPKILPPPLIKLKSKMPNQNPTISDKLETITISENSFEEKNSEQDITSSEESFQEVCVSIANYSVMKSKAFKSDSEKEQLELLRAEISKRMEKVDTEEGLMWKCTECGKRFKPRLKRKLEYHVETHLEGFTHTCSLCDKVHKTRYALQQHLSLHHKGGN